MARAKRGTKRRERNKKLFDFSEGFVLGRNNTFRRAQEAVHRSLAYAFRDRRVKKRDFRGLWITRLSAAAVENDISYSRLICALKKSDVQLNRKMLSEIAAHDPNGFTQIVEAVRAQAPSH